MAVLHVGETEQQLGEGGLARARASHQAHALTGFDVQVKVAKHAVALRGVRVGESNVLEIDSPAANRKVWCAGGVFYQTWLVQNARHLARVAYGAVHALHHGVDVVEPHGKLVGVGEHHHQHAA